VSTPRIAFSILVLAGIAGDSSPALAKILKTRRPTQYNQYHELALTIGSGFEYEGDEEEKQYDFPFLIEYGVSDALTLAIEPDYVVIKPAGPGSISGLGDLETSVVFEFVSERRSRPALSAEVLVKWPTATSDSLTTGETDYSVGGIVSKEFVHFELDSEALYTFVGDPAGVDLENALEISLAGAWHASRSMDVEIEAVTSSGGGFRGSGSSNLSHLPKDTGQEERESEVTLGVSQRLGMHLKLEAGSVFKSDGAWQLVAAWEWNFGEGD
jgi:hypothetical protein